MLLSIKVYFFTFIQDFENEWKIQTNRLSFADFDFTLSHHKLSTNSSNIADSDGKTGGNSH